MFAFNRNIAPVFFGEGRFELLAIAIERPERPDANCKAGNHDRDERDEHGDALLVRLVSKGLFFAFDGIKARYVKVRIRVFLGDAAEPSWIAGNTDFSITAGAQMRNVAGDLTSSVVDRDRCIERTMSPGRDRFALHDLLACRYGHVQGKRDVVGVFCPAFADELPVEFGGVVIDLNRIQNTIVEGDRGFFIVEVVEHINGIFGAVK